MRLRDVVGLLNARLVCGEQNLDREVKVAFASDLMSDVLTVERENMLLLTGLANVQVIRTAEMSDINMILLVRNKKASPEMIALAEQIGITLIECPLSLFKTSGILYGAGIKPVY